MSDNGIRANEEAAENRRIHDLINERDEALRKVGIQEEAAAGLAAMLHKAKLEVDALRTRGENAEKELAESNEKWLHKFGQYNDDIRRRLDVMNASESTQDAADRLRQERDNAINESRSFKNARDLAIRGTEEWARMYAEISKKLASAEQERDDWKKLYDGAVNTARQERDFFLKKLETQNVGAGNALVRAAIGEYNRTGLVLNLTPQDVAAILKEAIRTWFPSPTADLSAKE